VIRILLADDHAIVRDGLKRLFAMTADITVAAEAVNGVQVLEKLRQHRFDLVLLDMSMPGPGMSGADLIARIREQRSALPVLVLSMHNEPQIARRALNAGAAGYVTKDSEPETLLAAIRKVAQRGRFIDPHLAEQIVFDVKGAGKEPPHKQLTGREYQIMILLAMGKSVKAIAHQLSISDKTVSTHKARLMTKMKFRSNADLVRFAVANGLVR
jgi:DNA-binding NarL/FixJ family response regulator